MKFNGSLKSKYKIIDPVSVINALALVVIFFVLANNNTGGTGMVVDLPLIEQSELYKLDSAVVSLLGEKIYLFDSEVEMDKLQEELTKRNPQLLAIKADKNIPYYKIAEIVALAKRIGIKQIAIATEEPYKNKQNKK